MINNLSRALALSFYCALFMGWTAPAAAAPQAGTLADECIASGGFARGGLQQSGPVRNGEKIQACRERINAAMQAVKAEHVAQTMAAPAASVAAATCPATGHDIVVDSVAALRAAVSDPANAGKVIGIDGYLAADAQDVIVTADGVTITCASDGAGLAGTPIDALIWVQADDVTVEHLRLDATGATQLFALLYGDLFFRSGGAIVADDGVARRNVVTCPPSPFSQCILFFDVNGGLAEFNTVTSGFKQFGIGAVAGSNVTIADNEVADCETCVLIQSHEGGIVARNDVQQCTSICVWFVISSDGQAYDNTVSQAFLGYTSGSSSDISFMGNAATQCLGGCYTSGTVGAFPRPSGLSAVGNTATECSDIAGFGACLLFTQTDGVEVRDNVFSQVPNHPFGPPASVLFDVTDAEVRNNRLENGTNVLVAITDLVYADNEIATCSGTDCVGGGSLRNAQIIGNSISNFGDPGSGIFFDGLTGQTVVSGNTIQGQFFSGLYLEGETFTPDPDARASIFRNHIELTGEFVERGIEMSSLSNGRIEHNFVALDATGGPGESKGVIVSGDVNVFTVLEDGVVVFESASDLPARNNVVRGNRIMGAAYGLAADGACGNTFQGNNVAASEAAALFGLRWILEDSFVDPGTGVEITFINEGGGTGATVVAGNTLGIVEAASNAFADGLVGDGYLDCDGDGQTDPNLYSGDTARRIGLGSEIGGGSP